jgi:hypothetical protein
MFVLTTTPADINPPKQSMCGASMRDQSGLEKSLIKKYSRKQFGFF